MIYVAFGQSKITIKMHLMLHLGDCVLALGPLFVYICYHGENFYGDLRDHVKSTHEPTIGLALNKSMDIMANVLKPIASILDEIIDLVSLL